MSVRQPSTPSEQSIRDNEPTTVYGSLAAQIIPAGKLANLSCTRNGKQQCMEKHHNPIDCYKYACEVSAFHSRNVESIFRFKFLNLSKVVPYDNSRKFS